MTPARIRDVLLSLLLGMALALAWPTMGKLPPRSGSAAPHAAAGAEAAAAVSAVAGGAHGHHRTLPDFASGSAPDAASGSAPDCVPDTGCCVMTQCHPGLVLALPEMPRTAPLRAQEPDVPRGAVGVDPAILVPPPRSLPV